MCKLFCPEQFYTWDEKYNLGIMRVGKMMACKVHKEELYNMYSSHIAMVINKDERGIENVERELSVYLYFGKKTLRRSYNLGADGTILSVINLEKQVSVCALECSGNRTLSENVVSSKINFVWIHHVVETHCSDGRQL
jgi:hypothetical protein